MFTAVQSVQENTAQWPETSGKFTLELKAEPSLERNQKT